MVKYVYFIEDAQKIEKLYKIPTSITLAQIIQEAAGGSHSPKNELGLSGLAYKDKNLFGVKAGNSWKGKTVQYVTTEYYNGKKVSITSSFRKYDSYYESMVDRAQLLANPRYLKHLQLAKTVEEFAKGLQLAGYATDPNYSKNLISLINKYNLKQYDNVISEKTCPSTYQGNSIVDYLKSIGQPSSFSARKKLAQQHGISNYEGLASQNLLLLKFLRG